MDDSQAPAIPVAPRLKGQNRLRLVGLGFVFCFTAIAAGWRGARDQLDAVDAPDSG